ncbi:MAG: Rieske (2Fe-2S) protein, partial [Planctomycetota bacterium]|nr:Rieske (2Fe-2S) protein [Planctomycetota bacterium]
FFHWASALLSGAYLALLAVPGVGFLTEPFRRKSKSSKSRKLVRVKDLEVGVPRRVVLRDQRTDAWTKYAEGTIGAVWVVRTGEADVDVFSVVCPHLGCPVDYVAEEKQFFCPCHAASYAANGTTIAGPQKRGLDRLESKIESVGGEPWVSIVFAKFEPGIPEQVPLV